MGEVVKYALIGNKKLNNYMQLNSDAIKKKRLNALEHIIEESIKSLELQKSLNKLQKSFNRLSKNSLQTNSKRFNNINFYQPGPGQYIPPTEFQTKSLNKLSSTFSKSKRKDLLSTMKDAGHVSTNELGPGSYNIKQKTFLNDSLNTRCGYIPSVEQTQTIIRPFKYKIPSQSLVFQNLINSSSSLSINNSSSESSSSLIKDITIDSKLMFEKLMEKPNPYQID